MKTQKPNAVRCAQTAEIRVAGELVCFSLVSTCFHLCWRTYSV